MISQTLAGRSILLVEDEPLVAMDVALELEKRGARVHTAYTLSDAINAVEGDGLSAAILDHGLRGGDSTCLQERLEDRRIPFLIYSGYSQTYKAIAGSAPVIEKPADMGMLVGTLEALLKGHRWRYLRKGKRALDGSPLPPPVPAPGTRASEPGTRRRPSLAPDATALTGAIASGSMRGGQTNRTLTIVPVKQKAVPTWSGGSRCAGDIPRGARPLCTAGSAAVLGAR